MEKRVGAARPRACALARAPCSPGVLKAHARVRFPAGKGTVGAMLGEPDPQASLVSRFDTGDCAWTGLWAHFPKHCAIRIHPLDIERAVCACGNDLRRARIIVVFMLVYHTWHMPVFSHFFRVLVYLLIYYNSESIGFHALQLTQEEIAKSNAPPFLSSS